MNVRSWKPEWGLLLSLVLPLIAILPVLDAGTDLVRSADMPVHLHRSFAMTEMFQSGNLYPRWIPYFRMGYGYPIFNFYAPGSVTLTALLHLAGVHLVVAGNLTVVLCWMVSSAGVYRLARQFLPVTGALLAAMLWSYAPSRLFEYWWQGSLAQIVSTSIMPWFFLYLVRTLHQPGSRDVAIGAIFFAGVILTHTPTTYITGLFAGLAVLIIPPGLSGGLRRDTWIRWLYGGISLVLGAGLAAIFLLPVVQELQYVLIRDGIDGTVNFLRSQFLSLADVFALPQPIDVTDQHLVMPRTAGLISGLLAVTGILALIRRRRIGVALLLLAGCAFIVFMTQPQSLDVWLAIPSFRNLRYPERLLRMMALLLALAGGASLLWLPVRWQVAGLIAGMILAVAQVLPMIDPPVRYDESWQRTTALDELIMEYTDRAWGTTSYDEFKPAWGGKRPFDMPPDPESYQDAPLQIRIHEDDLTAYGDTLAVERLTDNSLLVQMSEGGPVRLRQFYFPGWQVTVNGEIVDIYPEDEYGLLTVDLPPGQHTIRVTYVGTPVQWIATFISLSCLMMTGTMLVIGIRRSSPEPESSEPLQAGTAGWLAGGLLVAALFNWLILTPSQVFIIESPPDDPYYMQTSVDAAFGDSLTLIGYTLAWDTIAPGQYRDVMLYWHTPETLEEEYRPLVQLVNLSRTAALAVSEPLLPSGGKTTTFTPDTFTSDVHSLTLFPDVSPALGQLSVQMISLRTGEPLRLPDGTDRLILEPLIRIQTPGIESENVLDIAMDHAAVLWCVSITESDDTLMIQADWHLTGNYPHDLVVFVHGLDDSGALIAQNDKTLFDGDYPPVFWQAGQTVRDRYTLPPDADITQIALGWYLRDDPSVRVPVRSDGESVPDNRIVLPRTESSCTR